MLHFYDISSCYEETERPKVLSKLHRIGTDEIVQPEETQTYVKGFSWLSRRYSKLETQTTEDYIL